MSGKSGEPAHVALVRKAHDAAGAEGPQILMDRYEEWFSPDFEWHPVLLESLDGRTFRGKEGFGEYWREFLETFGDVRFLNGVAEAVDERRVLLHGSVAATGASSGAPIDREVVYVFEVEDGLIARGRSFFSREDAVGYLAEDRVEG